MITSTVFAYTTAHAERGTHVEPTHVVAVGDMQSQAAHWFIIVRILYCVIEYCVRIRDCVL